LAQVLQISARKVAHARQKGMIKTRYTRERKREAIVHGPTYQPQPEIKNVICITPQIASSKLGTMIICDNERTNKLWSSRRLMQRHPFTFRWYHENTSSNYLLKLWK